MSDLKEVAQQYLRQTLNDPKAKFREGLEEVFPGVRHQRCWVHKTANVLDKLPKSLQSPAKAKLKEIYMAPTRK